MTRPRSETTSTDEPDPFAKARGRMVDRQLRRRGIQDERVLAAMAEVPRERFVPPEARADAYRDGALAIGEGQTISQPWIVACMTTLLELRGDERVLEVGTGSGYGAAVLSRCCREVISIERHAALAESAREVLGELGYANVEVRTGDGTRGAPDRAPFQGISVTATAAGGPPQALFDQLVPGAALVCPVRRRGDEYLMRFRDDREEQVAPVRFVPLVGMELDGEPPGSDGGRPQQQPSPGA
jgi:protein-L-isoaspartate(D-aspartate) O-methyltransferase